jgi:hypothetical protein
MSTIKIRHILEENPPVYSTCPPLEKIIFKAGGSLLVHFIDGGFCFLIVFLDLVVCPVLFVPVKDKDKGHNNQYDGRDKRLHSFNF